tara:strand:+ start:5482 stop:6570 length:1089 start_codon:yes stop_codon:yes gene_type:complete
MKDNLIIPNSISNWRQALVSSASSIYDAIAILDTSALQICMVTDESGQLLGTVTDGDIRRALLKGAQMSDPLINFMNADPRTTAPDTAPDVLLTRMKQEHIRQLPLVDARNMIVGLANIDDLISDKPRRTNWVVLMAGGLGKRLQPLTNDTPKPLIEVGGRPILETIIQSFIGQGFHRFYIAVNYHSEQIKTHFGDGKKIDAEIHYLEETKTLGTAGALGLIDPLPEEPVIVMNGDLLTKVNFDALLDFNIETEADASLAIREYDLEVPFGVVELSEDGQIADIVEKPVHRFFVNAGIYVLQPKALKFLDKNTSLDMPTLFKMLIDADLKTNVYPVREYWLDIGRIDDLDRARREYKDLFGD